jgi:hypothetical protein
MGMMEGFNKSVCRHSGAFSDSTRRREYKANGKDESRADHNSSSSCVGAIGLASGPERVGQKIEPILAPKHLAVEHIAW